MSFILVIVPKPDELTLSLNQAWGAFYTFAKVESLKAMAGVFYIDDTAWIFDTRTALREFALVTHRATEQGIQLHSFQLVLPTIKKAGSVSRFIIVSRPHYELTCIRQTFY